MSEKFRKIVNAPHRAVGRTAKAIKDSNPTKVVGKVARGAGIGSAGIMQFVLWLAKYATLDNHLTRMGERKFANVKVEKNKKGKDKKFSKFIKQNPNFTAIVSYWMLLASLVGGYKLGEDLASDDSVIKARVEYILNEIKHHDGEIEKLKLDPTADDETWQKQIDAVHPYVVAHIFSSEGYIADSYDDNGGKGTPTVGAGFTIKDTMHKKFAERVLERPVSSDNFHVTKSEARLLTESWLKEMVYPEIRSQFNKPLDYKLFTILAVAGYNRGEKTYRKGNTGHPVSVAVNADKSKQDILQAYITAFGGTKNTKWGGLANKYAVSALYYSGDVRDTTILYAIAEAPYSIEQDVAQYQKQNHITKEVSGRLLTYDNKGRVNGIIVPDNINGMLLKTKYRKTQGTVQEPVMAYMTQNEVDIITRGRMFDGVKKEKIIHLRSDDIETSNTVISNDNFDSEYASALHLFNTGKYESAASSYENMIKKYPDNALLRNDLATTYNHLGRYDDAIKHSQEIVKRIGDKSQYAAAQYNAGFAYEQKGDLQRALANYKLSVANGNRRVQSDITRVKNKMNNREKNKTVAFNDAASRVKLKSKNIDLVHDVKNSEYSA